MLPIAIKSMTVCSYATHWIQRTTVLMSLIATSVYLLQGSESAGDWVTDYVSYEIPNAIHAAVALRGSALSSISNKPWNSGVAKFSVREQTV